MTLFWVGVSISAVVVSIFLFKAVIDKLRRITMQTLVSLIGRLLDEVAKKVLV